jgi:hypothetical protein
MIVSLIRLSFPWQGTSEHSDYTSLWIFPIPDREAFPRTQLATNVPARFDDELWSTNRTGADMNDTRVGLFGGLKKVDARAVAVDSERP